MTTKASKDCGRCFAKLDQGEIVYRQRKTPKRLKHYFVGHLLGEGSFCKVREGYDTVANLPVAIKYMNLKKLKRIPGGEASLAREINVLEQLPESSFVIQLVEHWTDPSKDKIYVVLEYIGCGTLKTLIENAPGKRLPPAQIRFLFAQLLDALEFLHSRGVFHRDVKPDNIMMSSERHIMLTDFGSCLVSETGVDIAADGIGAPAFQPPEVATTGKSPNASKIDIWAAGITLYFMATGTYPFKEQSNVFSLFKEIAECKVVVPSDVPDALVDLINGILRRDPATRFTIQDIRAHPFMKSAPITPSSAPSDGPEPSVVGEEDFVIPKMAPTLFTKESLQRFLGQAVNATRNSSEDYVYSTDDERLQPLGGGQKRKSVRQGCFMRCTLLQPYIILCTNQRGKRKGMIQLPSVHSLLTCICSDDPSTSTVATSQCFRLVWFIVLFFAGVGSHSCDHAGTSWLWPTGSKGELRMKICLVLVVSLLLVSSCLGINRPLGEWDDVQEQCLGCTLGLHLIREYATLLNTDIVSAAAQFCTLLPTAYARNCTSYATNYAPTVQQLLEDLHSPDVVCHGIGLCSGLEQCFLFPQSESQSSQEHLARPVHSAMINSLARALRGGVSFVSSLRGIVPTAPSVDQDGDLFAATPCQRGCKWRGKDCNDSDSSIRPGSSIETLTGWPQTELDGNCNGIPGTINEMKLCADSPQYGVAVLGDSAAAGCEILTGIVQPANWSQAFFDIVLDALGNGFDWPETSMVTGYRVPTSIYSRVVQRNLCARGDFQNIGINGAESSWLPKMATSVMRNQTMDKPLLLVLNIIGDDICNADTPDEIPTPEQFKANIMKTLTYLDQHVLPPQSHVVFMGLANGSVLAEIMADKLHPIGGGATYSEVYDYMSCMGINPCPLWLTSNAQFRAESMVKAVQLNAVWKEIVQNEKFTNFDSVHYDTMEAITRIVADYLKQGLDPAVLITPFDGFHPSQVLDRLLSDEVWNLILEEWSDSFSTNPSNSAIASRFPNGPGLC